MSAPRLFVCGACGKEAASRDAFADVSCAMWAVAVDPASVERDASGRVVKAIAVGELHACKVSGVVIA